MKTWLKILIILAVVGLIAAFLVWKFMINKPHTDYSKAKADIEITASELFNQYTANNEIANTSYLDKVIQLSGKLTKTEITDTSCIVVFVFKQGDFGDEGVRCILLQEERAKGQQLKPDQDITIKGHCTGFLSDVIVEKCVIIEK